MRGLVSEAHPLGLVAGRGGAAGDGCGTGATRRTDGAGEEEAVVVVTAASDAMEVPFATPGAATTSIASGNEERKGAGEHCTSRSGGPTAARIHARGRGRARGCSATDAGDDAAEPGAVMQAIMSHSSSLATLDPKRSSKRTAPVRSHG